MSADAGRKLHGPLLIALASSLWATDALFRMPSVQALHPLLIVFIEHSIALLVLLPLVLRRHGHGVLRLNLVEWVSILLIGAGASASATVLFTASFRFVNPSVAILIQKLQPVLCVIFAHAFLGERPRKQFYVWAPLAFAAGFLISFPDLDFGFLLGRDVDFRSKGVGFALAAAAIWALATVAGKVLLRNMKAEMITFWRFGFGFLTLALLLGLGSGAVDWSPLAGTKVWGSLAYMALFPGLLAVFIYYRGLNLTSASIATFVELLFPVAAVILNTVFLGLALDPVQIAASAVMLFAVTMISLKG